MGFFRGNWFTQFQYVFCSNVAKLCAVAMLKISFRYILVLEKRGRLGISILSFWKNDYYTFTMKYAIFWKLHRFRLSLLLTRRYKNYYWNICSYANFGHLNQSNFEHFKPSSINKYRKKNSRKVCMGASERGKSVLSTKIPPLVGIFALSTDLSHSETFKYVHNGKYCPMLR